MTTSSAADTGALPVQYLATGQAQATGVRYIAALTATNVLVYKTSSSDSTPSLVANLECDLRPISIPGKGHDPNKLANPSIAAFSADGRHLAIAGEEKTLRVWEVKDAEEGWLQHGTERLVKMLPKKVAVLLWETEDRVIVGDRHGDIRR